MEKIKICIGSSCQVKGAYKVVQILEELIEKEKLEIELEGSFCMGKCQEGVSLEYQGVIYSASPENAKKIFIEMIGEK